MQLLLCIYCEGSTHLYVIFSASVGCFGFDVGIRNVAGLPPLHSVHQDNIPLFVSTHIACFLLPAGQSKHNVESPAIYDEINLSAAWAARAWELSGGGWGCTRKQPGQLKTTRERT